MNQPPVTTRIWNMFSSPGTPWVWVSMVLYVIACFLPACWVYGNKPAMGWECLVLTFTGLLFLPYSWPNPLYFAALLSTYFKWHKTAAVFACLSVLPAMAFEFMTLRDGRGLLPGCIMWTTSLQVLALNAVCRLWVAYRSRQTELEPD